MSGQLLHQWPVKPIADICEIFSDGNWIESKDQSPSGIRLVQTGNIGEGVFKDRKDKARYISESTFSRLNCTEIFEGDCLISRLPRPVGRACLIPNTGERMITAVDCSILRLKQDMILPQFFVYYSQSAHYNNQIQPLCTGSTRKRISRKNLGKITIPIPPLEVQQRIVSLLDEAFENISETVLQTKNSLFQNNELYKQMLNQIFENSNGEWVEKTLDNICTIKRGSSPRPIKSYITEDPNGVSWIKIGDTKGVDKYITKTKQKITKEGAERSRLVNKGDLILSNSMSYGKPFIMGISGYIHDGWFVLYVNKEVDSEFLFYALSSRLVQSQFSNLAAGSVVKNISGDLVKKAVIPIPPLSEQKQLVEDIKSMTPSIKSLTSISNAKLKSLDDLKQSILQEAFNGTL